jgi:hypothetical protein
MARPVADQTAVQHTHQVLLERASKLQQLNGGAQLAELHNQIDEIRSDNPFDALTAISVLRRWLDLREFEMVRIAREEGVSWHGIAGALGRSKQAVWERFRNPLDPSDRIDG